MVPYVASNVILVPSGNQRAWKGCCCRANLTLVSVMNAPCRSHAEQVLYPETCLSGLHVGKRV